MMEISPLKRMPYRNMTIQVPRKQAMVQTSIE
jgi:hypothetical protein